MYLKIRFNPMILSLFQNWQMLAVLSWLYMSVLLQNAFFVPFFRSYACVHSTFFPEIIQMDMIKLEPGVFCLCVKTETETNGLSFFLESERESFERIKNVCGVFWVLTRQRSNKSLFVNVLGVLENFLVQSRVNSSLQESFQESRHKLAVCIKLC